jgi:hypothetical protein
MREGDFGSVDSTILIIDSKTDPHFKTNKTTAGKITHTKQNREKALDGHTYHDIQSQS